MTTYILRRVVQAIPVVIGITLFKFLMIHLAPGDPVTIIAGDKPISKERQAQIRSEFGLDDPIWTQYTNYMRDLFHGDMGKGLFSQRPVTETLREAAWPTIQLTIAGLFVAIVLGISLGILAALFHN